MVFTYWLSWLDEGVQETLRKRREKTEENIENITERKTKNKGKVK